MFDNQIDDVYKTLIMHLILNGYKCRKEFTQRLYQKENIIIKFNSSNITIKDINDNRRYYFNFDTPETVLVNFLDFLNNNYSKALIY
jgi:hypothetical protein